MRKFAKIRQVRSVASATGRDALKISFECSILYRLLLLMGAQFLRSSRCRKATGRSIQLIHRNPSGCPLPWIGGKLAQLGRRLINSAAKKTADDFFEKFRAAVATDSTATSTQTVYLEPSTQQRGTQ